MPSQGEEKVKKSVQDHLQVVSRYQLSYNSASASLLLRELPAPTGLPVISQESSEPNPKPLGMHPMSIINHLQRCSNPFQCLVTLDVGEGCFFKVKERLRVNSNPSKPKVQQFCTCAGPGLFFLLTCMDFKTVSSGVHSLKEDSVPRMGSCTWSSVGTPRCRNHTDRLIILVKTTELAYMNALCKL